MTIKLALLIGINYYGTKSELRGCVNDVHAIRGLLTDVLGYESSNIGTLTDGAGGDDAAVDAATMPTRANIETRLRALAEEATRLSASEVFVSFSGHGTNVRDRNGDEADGSDEAIVPVDYAQSGVILDDQLAQLWALFPRGCRVTCVFDSCNSGTVGDLSVVHRCTQSSGRRVREPMRRRVRYGDRYVWRRYYGWKTLPGEWSISRTSSNTDTGSDDFAATLLAISGCRDDGTSADAFNQQSGAWGGALTDALVSVMRARDDIVGELTCDDLLMALNKRMAEAGMSQRPVVSCNRAIGEGAVFFRKRQICFVECSTE